MSESIKVTGAVRVIEETKEYGSNGFTKRTLVIEVPDGQYSNMIPVEAIKDKCSMFDALNEGDTVTASVNMRSNEWKGKYFLSLNCWKISVDTAADGEKDRPALDGVGTGSPEAPAGKFDDDIPF